MPKSHAEHNEFSRLPYQSLKTNSPAATTFNDNFSSPGIGVEHARPVAIT